MGKQFQNYRFRKTEKAIIDAFFASKRMLRSEDLARRAGISRTTLFRHHRTVHEIVPNYEKMIYQRYARMVGVILRNRKLKTREIYLRILFFIMKYRDTFKLFLTYGNGVIFEKMIWRLENKICGEYYLPRNSEQVFEIYVKEITGVLEGWGKCEFDIDEMGVVLGKIMYLTETMRVRLLPILKKD